MKRDKLGRQAGSGSQEGLRDKAAATAKSEVMKGDKPAAAAKSEVMKGDKLGRQAGSGSQERNQEGNAAAAAARQAGETRWQRQPRAKS